MTAVDLLVIGGGINGAGIARDAAGRGLAVMLVEQDDLASHTSSASTKLVHGGLRYLEQYQFGLVRESLAERERLLAIAPHIVRPLTFILPHRPGMRPAWMIRLGLFLYDHLGRRRRLPGSRALKLRGSPFGAGLDPAIEQGFAYADCRVDDARLVVLNAMDAAARGAAIRTRTRLASARRDGGAWTAELLNTASGDRKTVRAGAIVNATGPWVGAVLGGIEGMTKARPPRLIKGSHIIVARQFPGEHAYIFQHGDGRVIFAIPYEGEFTLIGTTDIGWSGDPRAPSITDEEIDYLCAGVSRYLARPISPADVIASYSGIRALHDDGAKRASEVTRDYELRLDASDGLPLLSVFGGKLTTYRRLAEQALGKLAPYFPRMKSPWTATAPLPGGDLPGSDFDAFLAEVESRWPFLPARSALRLGRSYGTRIEAVIGGARSLEEMGEDFGGLSAREIDYLIQREWARTPQDILWRRTKLGLDLAPEDIARVSAYMRNVAKLPERAHG